MGRSPTSNVMSMLCLTHNNLFMSMKPVTLHRLFDWMHQAEFVTLVTQLKLSKRLAPLLIDRLS